MGIFLRVGREIRHRTRRVKGGASSSLVAAAQTLALHAPDQEVDAVLSEERLVFECKGRHAPMARGGMVLLIVGDYPLVPLGIGRYRGVHCGEVEACRGCRLGEMV